ncbi:MAG: acyl-CoA dehydrogenase family protein [Selenomonadaceae bacterium]
MDYVMTEEDELIQQNAGEFSAEYIEPIAVDLDKTGIYPKKTVDLLAENGFMGLCFSSSFNGAEASYVSYILALEEIAKVSAGVASILLNHVSLAAYSVNKWGTADQKNKYLSELCTGEKLGAFAWAEADSAPGLNESSLKAVKADDNYILNGKKCYVANGGEAGLYLAAALTADEESTKKFSIFIVPANVQGIHIVRKIDKMGLRACPWVEMSFENCKIPVENLLGQENNGLIMIKEAYLAANVAEGAVAIGIMEAALKEASEYAKNRIQFKRPIAKFPAIQNMLADIAGNLELARLAVYDAAGKITKNKPFMREAATIKKFLSNVGTQALIDAVQVEGGYGFCEDMSVSRLYRDINGLFFTESSEDFAEQIIAKEI